MCISPKIFRGQVFDCGKCIDCVNKRIKAWATRIYLHSSQHKDDSIFLTLTYNPQNLPKNGLLNKRDYQLFLKRLRKYFPDKKISYFMCGEYGDENGRPHYHFILFGISPTDFNINVIESSWRKGFIRVEKVNMKTCRYVAKYCCKTRQKEKLDPVTGEVMAEFVQMSKRPALCKEWFFENFADLFKHDEPPILKIGKYSYSYPQVFRKWYKEKIGQNVLVNTSDILIVPDKYTEKEIFDLALMLRLRHDLRQKYEVIKAGSYFDILKSKYVKQRQFFFSRGCDVTKDDKSFRKYQDFYYYYTRDSYLIVHQYENMKLGFFDTNIKD